MGALIGINNVGSADTAANVTVVNNYISIVPSFANDQIVKGIQDAGLSGNTFTADYNSVFGWRDGFWEQFFVGHPAGDNRSG